MEETKEKDKHVKKIFKLLSSIPNQKMPKQFPALCLHFLNALLRGNRLAFQASMKTALLEGKIDQGMLELQSTEAARRICVEVNSAFS